jgi:hypothetical protein
VKIILVVLICAGGVWAQDVQIPFDSAGVVLVVSPELEGLVHLFPQYDGFREARLYRETDSTATLEVLFLLGSETKRDRKLLTVAELIEMRRVVTEAMRGKYFLRDIDQSGRGKLMVGQTLLGLGFYGWALPVAMKVDDPTSFTALYWVIAGSSFFVPYFATMNSPVTRGEATLSLQGSTRGPVHGLALAALTEPDENKGEHVAFLASVVGISEGVGGYIWAKNANLSDGSAAIIGTGGDFGMAIGFAAGFLGEALGEDEDRLTASGMLLGALGGTATAAIAAHSYGYTRGDQFVIRAAGYLGTLIPISVIEAANVESEDPYIVAGIVGSLTGLTVGNGLVHGRHFSTAQGTEVMAAEIAGALVGLGIGVAVAGDDGSSVLLGTAVGASAGFTIAYTTNNRKARLRQNKLSELTVEPTLLSARSLDGGRLRAVPGLHIGCRF